MTDWQVGHIGLLQQQVLPALRLSDSRWELGTDAIAQVQGA